MRPKFQKRSALKFDGRIIPEAKRLCRNVFARELLRLPHALSCVHNDKRGLQNSLEALRDKFWSNFRLTVSRLSRGDIIERTFYCQGYLFAQRES